MKLTGKTLVADTNVISYVYNAHSLSSFYEPLIADNAILLSFQTLEELRFGALKANWGQRRLTHLENFIKPHVIVFSNDALCLRSAQLRVEANRKGSTISHADAWIAATALEFDIPLITHNKKDFDFLDTLHIITENDD